MQVIISANVNVYHLSQRNHATLHNSNTEVCARFSSQRAIELKLNIMCRMVSIIAFRNEIASLKAPSGESIFK